MNTNLFHFLDPRYLFSFMFVLHYVNNVNSAFINAVYWYAVNPISGCILLRWALRPLHLL